MKKKTLILASVILTLATLTACGGGNNNTTPNETNNNSSNTEIATETGTKKEYKAVLTFDRLLMPAVKIGITGDIDVNNCKIEYFTDYEAFYKDNISEKDGIKYISKDNVLYVYTGKSVKTEETAGKNDFTTVYIFLEVMGCDESKLIAAANSFEVIDNSFDENDTSYIKTVDAVSNKDIVKADIEEWIAWKDRESNLGHTDGIPSHVHSLNMTSDTTTAKTYGEMYKISYSAIPTAQKVLYYAFDSSLKDMDMSNILYKNADVLSYCDGKTTSIVYTQPLQLYFGDDAHTTVYFGVIYNDGNDTKEAIYCVCCLKTSDGWVAYLGDVAEFGENNTTLSNMVTQKANFGDNGLTVTGR